MESWYTNSLLEAHEVHWAESVGLCDDRDQVNSRAKTFHDLNVKRLEGVAGWADEVEAGVDTKVNSVNTAWLLLLKHIRLVLVVQELDNWLP